MSEILLKITGQIKERYGNKELGTFEIVCFDNKVKVVDPDPNKRYVFPTAKDKDDNLLISLLDYESQPDRLKGRITTKDTDGNTIVSQEGVVAGINDPSQPLTFAIKVETVNQEIEYAGIIILFNDKKKFKGRMFPYQESILLACAKEEETFGKMKELLNERKKRELKLVASFDSKLTKIMVSIYNAKAVNLLKSYNNATVEELSALY